MLPSSGRRRTEPTGKITFPDTVFSGKNFKQNTSAGFRLDEPHATSRTGSRRANWPACTNAFRVRAALSAKVNVTDYELSRSESSTQTQTLTHGLGRRPPSGMSASCSAATTSSSSAAARTSFASADVQHYRHLQLLCFRRTHPVFATKPAAGHGWPILLLRRRAPPPWPPLGHVTPIPFHFGRAFKWKIYYWAVGTLGEKLKQEVAVVAWLWPIAAA